MRTHRRSSVHILAAEWQVPPEPGRNRRVRRSRGKILLPLNPPVQRWDSACEETGAGSYNLTGLAPMLRVSPARSLRGAAAGPGFLEASEAAANSPRRTL